MFIDKKIEIILVKINKYEASEILGSKAWCIVGDKNQFLHYTDNGKNAQYFVFNFSDNIEPNEKMLGFTLDYHNNVIASQDRYNNQYDAIGQTLSKWGIKEKVYYFNSREFLKSSLHDYKELTYDDYDVIENENRIIKIDENGDFKLDKHSIAEFKHVFLDFISTHKNNLDIIVKTFQNIEFEVNDYSQTSNNKQFKNYKKELNVLPFIINSLKSDKYVNLFTKVLGSKFDLKENTKRSILYYLKNNGVDILSLVKNIKTKRGNDLTDNEVGQLTKRGENLTPMISNKIAAIRRGDSDVSLTTKEIEYAIDNGYKKIIRYYYNKQLPTYFYEPLEYDDMKIYQKLGLFNELQTIILKKAKTFGLETLNSIEKSLYDHANK